ncbi:MAG: hypothetical protein CMF59_10335 [Leptospiraceae bacterium]|nr:hypothetical protein [Leptospiraceae bacterium]
MRAQRFDAALMCYKLSDSLWGYPNGYRLKADRYSREDLRFENYEKGNREEAALQPSAIRYRVGSKVSPQSG